jgi:hypothetical protein
MATWIMGGGQIKPLKEHRLSIALTKTCYRGLLNDAPQEEMPPRKTYKEAVNDLKQFEKVITGREGGMCVTALACHSPRKVLAGTAE